MAVVEQKLTEKYAAYNGDCVEVMRALPDGAVHLSVYSPPFCGLYQYSSSPRDLSNCDSYERFFEHYAFVVRQLARVTMPGRMTAVHCMDVPSGNSGCDHIRDFPGDIVRLHEREGWKYVARYSVWKEPLEVRMRTLVKGLAHQTIVEDASRCCAAGADYLLVFRRDGENPVPIEHPTGFLTYAGSRKPPAEVLRFRGHKGKQVENSFSHWIWRQYASAFWDDVRIDRVLPFKAARDDEDEKHVHPLQLDVIERVVSLWSNPGEVVLTPFMGVGSEVYGALSCGRRSIGIELKESYYRQAVKNLDAAQAPQEEQPRLFETDAGDVTQDRPSPAAKQPGTWSVDMKSRRAKA